MRITKPIQNETPDRTAKTAQQKKHAQTCRQVDTNHTTRHIARVTKITRDQDLHDIQSEHMTERKQVHEF